MQVYRLLYAMSASLPPPLSRFPLFADIATHDSTTVSFHVDMVVKHIRNFSSFSKQHHTSFAEIQQAYKVAEEAGAAATGSGKAPWLVYACDKPVLTRNETFKVALRPVGYRAAPITENVSDNGLYCKHDPWCLYSHCFFHVHVFRLLLTLLFFVCSSSVCFVHGGFLGLCPASPVSSPVVMPPPYTPTMHTTTTTLGATRPGTCLLLRAVHPAPRTASPGAP